MEAPDNAGGPPQTQDTPLGRVINGNPKPQKHDYYLTFHGIQFIVRADGKHVTLPDGKTYAIKDINKTKQTIDIGYNQYITFDGGQITMVKKNDQYDLQTGVSYGPATTTRQVLWTAPKPKAQATSAPSIEPVSASGGGSTAASKAATAAAGGTSSPVYQAIARAAKENGVPLSLALAIAYHESGFNVHAVGDNGSSFGLYQLHVGGELGNHSQAWANDPYNNASTALRVVGQVLRQHPDLSPGQVAALAQRPADQASYAAGIDGVLHQASSDPHFFAAKLAGAPSGVGADAGYGGFGAGSYGAYNGGVNGQYNWSQQDFTSALNGMGFATALINSDPNLKALFQEAVQKKWSTDEFYNALQNNPWFKARSATQRQFDELHYSDPKTWQTNINQTADQLMHQAAAVGANITHERALALAQTVLRNGLNPDEIQQTLAAEIHYNPKGTYGGTFGDSLSKIKQMAMDYGVSLSDQTIGQFAQNVAGGQADMTKYENYVKQQALSKYPWLKDQINSGLTVSQIADPYKQEMASILEIDPNKINLSDPTVMKGLQYMDPNNTKAGYNTMPLYAFQDLLRNDPRWAKTDNARNAAMDTGMGVLRTFGLVS